MLLNAVGLTFVFQLDDQLMSKRDYKATEILFREISQGKQLKDVSQRLKERGYFEPQSVAGCWQLLTVVTEYLITFGVYLLMAAAPFFHAICY